MTPNEFHARKLHNLLLFYEHPTSAEGRERSAESVARALRQYLVECWELRGYPAGSLQPRAPQPRRRGILGRLFEGARR